MLFQSNPVNLLANHATEWNQLAIQISRHKKKYCKGDPLDSEFCNLFNFNDFRKYIPAQICSTFTVADDRVFNNVNHYNRIWPKCNFSHYACQCGWVLIGCKVSLHLAAMHAISRHSCMSYHDTRRSIHSASRMTNSIINIYVQHKGIGKMRLGRNMAQIAVDPILSGLIE